MAIDMFERRTMLAALESLPPKRTFLKDLFFNNVVTSNTEKIDVDIYKGNQKMAAFVSPKIGSITVKKDGWKTETYTPPLIGLDDITTAEDLITRSIGENVYSLKSPQERAAEMLLRDMARLDTMIEIREEWMCAKALFTGAVDVSGEGVSQNIDFGMSNTHKITLGTGAKWTDSGVNPLSDIATWRTLIAKDSFLSADICIMGATAAKAFLNNAEVQKLLDIRNIDLGIIKPQELPSGAKYIGSDRLSGVDYYTYEGFYVDPTTGLQTPFVPDGQVLLASKAARTSMMYGAVTLADENTKSLLTYAEARVPDSWVSKKPAARFIQLNSRPLPVPHDIDGFVVATVV